jgi:TolB protein
MHIRIIRRLLVMAVGLTAAAAPAAAHQPDSGAWSPATELTAVNSPAMDGCPFPTRDGRQLFIASTRPGGFGGIDIWVAERPSQDAPWGTPVNLGPPINSQDNDFCPSPQPHGRFMFVSNRPNGCGGTDIYSTKFGGSGDDSG